METSLLIIFSLLAFAHLLWTASLWLKQIDLKNLIVAHKHNEFSHWQHNHDTLYAKYGHEHDLHYVKHEQLKDVLEKLKLEAENQRLRDLRLPEGKKIMDAIHNG